MNTLAEKVEKLLINNDCVVVPAFGGFIKNKKSAAIVGQKIVPPQVDVSFNYYEIGRASFRERV